jgi:hypothetical protein
MSLHEDDRFDEIEARLEAARPRLDAHELDRLSRTIRTKRQKEQPMRSRIAIIVMLVLGMTLSTTGVGLAISGSSGSGSAGNAQYPTTPAQQPEKSGNGGGVLGAVDESEPPAGGDTSPAAAASTPAVQETRQVTAQSSGELPFTGLAVIPIIAAGVALLLGGLLLRRQSGVSRS